MVRQEGGGEKPGGISLEGSHSNYYQGLMMVLGKIGQVVIVAEVHFARVGQFLNEKKALHILPASIFIDVSGFWNPQIQIKNDVLFLKIVYQGDNRAVVDGVGKN